MKSLFLMLLNILANLDPFLLPHNFLVILFTYMFLAVLDLHCCASFSAVAVSEWGATLLGSVLASHCSSFTRGAQAPGCVCFRNSGTWAQ